jgi:catechol 2,3-dioxygenase-like lactoylglutathione lyase family enzyme
VTVSLSFASLFVDDPERSAAWYQELFGLPEVEELASPWFRGLRIGPTVLGFSHPHAYELLELPVPPPGSGGVATFLTFEATDRPQVAALTDRASELGGVVVKSPYDTYYGAWQSVVQDPDGHAFRINFLPLTS